MKNKAFILTLALLCIPQRASSMETPPTSPQAKKAITGTIFFTNNNAVGYCGKTYRKTMSSLLDKEINNAEKCITTIGMIDKHKFSNTFPQLNKVLESCYQLILQNDPGLIEKCEQNYVDIDIIIIKMMFDEQYVPNMWCLPIELFKNKKENDIITFQNAEYSYELKFEGTPEYLAQLEENFELAPGLLLTDDNDIQELITQQIIAPHNNHYMHGPRGYKSPLSPHNNRNSWLNLLKYRELRGSFTQ